MSLRATGSRWLPVLTRWRQEGGPLRERHLEVSGAPRGAPESRQGQGERRCERRLPPDGLSWCVLGIESSCDDTGVAVVRGDGKIMGEALASQAKGLGRALGSSTV